jgi:hypothetical protein
MCAEPRLSCLVRGAMIAFHLFAGWLESGGAGRETKVTGVGEERMVGGCCIAASYALEVTWCRIMRPVHQKREVSGLAPSRVVSKNEHFRG